MTKKPKSPPEHWLVGFVTAMDDVPNRSVAWLLALVVGGCICCLCWLQRQEEQEGILHEEVEVKTVTGGTRRLALPLQPDCQFAVSMLHAVASMVVTPHTHIKNKIIAQQFSWKCHKKR